MIARVSSLLFVGGLAFLLFVLAAGLPGLQGPHPLGGAVLSQGPQQVGAANLVTSVVLAYRGFDTLGELSILFAAATAIGLVLGRSRGQRRRAPGGFILRHGADLIAPFLLVVGFYIIFHGHLTPGGGFQGGVVLAVAFFLPRLAGGMGLGDEKSFSLVEGLAGAGFILIGLLALFRGESFLTPLLSRGQLGSLLSAGTLPLLYLAVGLKVGAELSGLLVGLAEPGDEGP